MWSITSTAIYLRQRLSIATSQEDSLLKIYEYRSRDFAIFFSVDLP